MKPKEENIQTHQWIRKSKLADGEYVYLYTLDKLFDVEPPHQTLLGAQNPQFLKVN